MSEAKKYENFQFTAENLAKAEQAIKRYPEGRQASAVLSLLDLAQRQCGGWLPHGCIEYVAVILEMPPMRVLEVASFYTMFNLKPVGKHHVQICTTTPCWLRGSTDIVKTCEKKLGLKVGQCSDDQSFSLSEVECLGACVNAPMVQINDDYYEDLTPKSLDKILDDLVNGRKAKPGPQINRQASAPISGPKTTTDAGRA